MQAHYYEEEGQRWQIPGMLLMRLRHLQVLVAFSIDTDALGLLSRCAKCNGEFEDRCASLDRRCDWTL